MKRILCASVFAVLPLGAFAQSAADMVNDGKNPEHIVTYGMGYHQMRHSPLRQIDARNVKRLVPVWNTSLANLLGEQAQPLVYEGVMYVTNAAWTFAIDVATGRQIWRTEAGYDPQTPRVVCCGVSNKGAAIYGGKLFRTTLDAHVVALDMKTGKQVWKHKFAEWQEGYSSLAAPIVANGVLVTGMSGAEFGVRGFLDGWDPDTGRKLWRRYTIPGPGEKGYETWPQDDVAYTRGGGTTWITGSYDPELDLMYWGTGNAGPWNSKYRGGGDSLYSASVIAVRPTTGEIAWHYQFTPNDIYDFDGVNENVLADMRVDGRMRKVLMHADRNGFFYVLDRATGELLRAFPFGKVNWATHIDMQTGRPAETDIRKRLESGEEVELWPFSGTKNWAPMAYNPNTGMVYLNTIHLAQHLKHVPVEYKPGTRYTGAQVQRKRPAGAETEGYHEAMDPLTGKRKWQIKLDDHVTQAGMLTTDGGLVFTGRMTGEFIAIEEATGKVLWQFQTGSGINAPPVTFTYKGKQYVTVLSGIAGDARGRRAGPSVPAGGSVWTFALPD